ncbi:hypothetical protein ABZU86_22320, partial [Streptomyces sp. NPDC005271]
MAMIQKGMTRGATEDVVLRQLPWFTSPVLLWAAWHKIDLRSLVAGSVRRCSVACPRCPLPALPAARAARCPRCPLPALPAARAA